MTTSLRETYNGPLLVLNTKLHGYDMKLESIIVTIIYRIQYKLYNSTFIVFKPLSKREETIYFFIDTSKVNLTILVIVPWESLTYPKTWTLDKVATPQM